MSKASGNNQKAGVQSVERALSILETLGRNRAPMGVTRLAQSLGLKVPTVHNLLKTLTAHGYVVKEDDTAQYRLGFSCATLGRAYLRATPLPQIAAPFLQKLARELDETVIMAVMEHGEILFVMRVPSRKMLAVNFGRSWVKDGYASVCGRILLAFAPPERLDVYVRSHPVKESQAHDVKSRRDLDKILEKIRRDEFVFQWRENNTVIAMAAPIRDFTGDVVASVGLAMPAVRFPKNRRKEIADAVKRTARDISSQLGAADGARSEKASKP